MSDQQKPARRLLIIDDEAPLRSLLRRSFELRGYVVTELEDGKEVLNHLEGNPCDVVILDIALRESDGLEVFRRIHDVHPKLPVVVLTGMGFDDHFTESALGQGVFGFLSKTQSLPVIRDMVDKACEAKLNPTDP